MLTLTTTSAPPLLPAVDPADRHRWSSLDGPTLLAAHLPAVDRAIATVSRRRRLTRDASHDLASDVYVRLLQHDGAALRAFRGESGLTTYLVTVVQRILLDARIAAHGKWRPSACARRLGRVAVTLERLIYFDSRPLAEAAEIVRQQLAVTHTDDELRFLLALLPSRCRRRVVGDRELDRVCDGRPDAEAALVASASAPDRASIARALRRLPAADRALLGERFVRGRRLCDIARRAGEEEKRVYRRFQKALDALRAEARRNG
jgi:RNA polymerase sigma factor (sigma-70 family)